jgi:aspartate racemase
VKSVLGIIGGMGPLATADLFYKIIAHTDAGCDEEHIHIVIDNNPHVPDRTKAVLEGSDAPFPFIRDAAKRLEAMGADILLLPCNTSHVYYERLCESVSIPIINMIEETAKYLSETGTRKAGLLATTGALRARLYENALSKFGIEAVLPSASGQAEVMSVIYNGIKAGAQSYDTSALCAELERMTLEGAGCFILGCTELPVAFEKYGIAFPYIDPSLILAKAAITRAGYPVK